jgi:hypothetical protein
MSELLDVVTSLTRRWVDLYTRNLPPCDRQLRRDEIDSDLWEHQRLGEELGQASWNTGFDILIRLVLGIPADLAWRRATIGGAAQGRRHTLDLSKISEGGLRAMKRTLVVGAMVLTVMIGLFNALGGLGLALGRDVADASISVAALVGSGALLIAGVAVARRSPRAGTVLLAIGAIVSATFRLVSASNVPSSSGLGPVALLVISVTAAVPLLLAFTTGRKAVLGSRSTGER